MTKLLQHLELDVIKDDDDLIAAALDDLSTPALIASVVQLTGNPSYVRGPIRPREFVLNEFQGKLHEDEKAELRAQALEAIIAWRDAGCPACAPLASDVVKEVMDWIACETVAEDYAAMYVDEMDLFGENPRAFPIHSDPANPTALSVLIIGAGEGGLLAALRLQEAGIGFRILEKNHDVGGTWLENRYPGCRVDVASHYYSYSFGPNDSFSSYYTLQPELYRYFRTLLDEHGIAERVRWGAEVETAAWDDDTKRWNVSYRTADGTVGTESADVLISGVGLLNRPLIPDLPGLDRFTGPAFHSARWDDNVDLSGKRVALIGAGASGFQIGPAIMDQVAELTVFQRTPQWMAPNPRYHASVSAGERWAMRHLPGYGRWYRFMLMFQSSDKSLEMVRVDEQWPDFPRTANAFSAQRREVLAKWIEDNVGDDPTLREKVTPNYPPMSKRMLQDNGSWLRCLTQKHVTLDNSPIVEIGEHRVTTEDGTYDVDVIVLATGFRASEVLWPLEIIGRDGRSIAETWQGRPSAYCGVTIPGFPNFFMLAGPGTGLAHAGSVIFTTECQMRYIGRAISHLVEGDHRTIEVTDDAYKRYGDDLQAEVATLMWGHPSIEHSWYKSADGNVYVLSPWRLVDYWKRTAAVDPADHSFG